MICIAVVACIQVAAVIGHLLFETERALVHVAFRLIAAVFA